MNSNLKSRVLGLASSGLLVVAAVFVAAAPLTAYSSVEKIINSGSVSTSSSVSIEVLPPLADVSVFGWDPTTPPPVVTSQPASGTFNSGQSVTLRVIASQALFYQWYAGTTGNTTSPIIGATGASYTTPPLLTSNTTSYWVRVTNYSGSTDSATATFTYLPTDTATFRWAEYKALYADLTAVFGSNAEAYEDHWLKNGRFEGRLGRVPAFFDADAYLAAYGDLRAVFGSLPNGQKQVAAYNHYIQSGASEGRNFREDFRYLEYKAMYSDLSAAFGSNIQAYLQHWVNNGKAEGRLGRVPVNFDVDTYLNTYGDLKAAFGSLPTALKRVAAFNHYLDSGADEGRNFGEDFRWAEYKELYSDLKAAFGNSTQAYILHWLNFGKAEARLGRVPTLFAVDAYLNAYADLNAAFGRLPSAQKRVAAYNHYLDSGVNEGRTFSEEFRWADYKELYGDLRAAFGSSKEAYLLHWLLFGKNEGRVGRHLPTITTQPASAQGYEGTITTISVVAKNATSYQWYVGTSGDTTNPISGATEASYTTPALRSTTSYWVRITNPSGRISSATATIAIWAYGAGGTLTVNGTLAGASTLSSSAGSLASSGARLLLGENTYTGSSTLNSISGYASFNGGLTSGTLNNVATPLPGNLTVISTTGTTQTLQPYSNYGSVVTGTITSGTIPTGTANLGTLDLGETGSLGLGGTTTSLTQNTNPDILPMSGIITLPGSGTLYNTPYTLTGNVIVESVSSVTLSTGKKQNEVELPPVVPVNP